MKRIRPVQMTMPSESEMAQLVSDLGLKDHQSAVLNVTIHEAAAACKLLEPWGDLNNARDALDELNLALGHVERLLKAKHVRDAMNMIEANGQMGFLLSPSAAAAVKGYKDADVRVAAIEKLLSQEGVPNFTVSPVDLDALHIEHRQRQLMELVPQAMQFAISEMRAPIIKFLNEHSDKGGNRPLLDRDLLILLLARDAINIIGEKPTTVEGGKFADLCNQTLAACKISEKGLDTAIIKTLRSYRVWIGWYNLPRHVAQTRDLTQDELDAIPNDTEAF